MVRSGDDEARPWLRGRFFSAPPLQSIHNECLRAPAAVLLFSGCCDPRSNAVELPADSGDREVAFAETQGRSARRFAGIRVNLGRGAVGLLFVIAIKAA